jgi:hypothetical protein
MQTIGYYNYPPQSPMCIPCDDNHYCIGGYQQEFQGYCDPFARSVGCSDGHCTDTFACVCIAGWFPDQFPAMSTTCHACQAGTYTTGVINEECQSCVSPWYCPSGSSPIACGSEGSITTTDPFSISTGARDSSASCECAIGYGREVVGVSNVGDFPCNVTCSAGQASSTGRCTDCPFQHYCPSGTAIICPGANAAGEGSYTDAPGKTSLADCGCAIGYETTNVGLDDGICNQCDTGKYRNVQGVGICNDCEVGYYCASQGATTTSGVLDAGCWGNTGETIPCPADCGDDHYCPGDGLRYPCPPNASTRTTQATAIGDCNLVGLISSTSSILSTDLCCMTTV